MDHIGSILVHVDAGQHCAERLNLARMLAAQLEARLQALLALVPRVLATPLSLQEGMAALPLLDEIDAGHRRQARACFDRVTSRPGWPMEWLELKGEPAVEGFARHALHADLLILGQRDTTDPESFDVPVDFVEKVLTTCGRPGIVVPRRMSAAFEGFRTVLVGWQPTREAAQALDGALPLLQRAEEVHLITWTDDGDMAASTQDDVVDHLRLHGVPEAQCHRAPMPDDIGAALLTLAHDVGADLLVMGCYSHSRARELLFGGATRSVLRDMTLPVLMAH